jgi:iron complex transport system substrate-binding protein
MTPRTLAGLVVGISLTLAACGGSDPETAGDTTVTPETTAMAATEVPVESTAASDEAESTAPQAIISLSPTATEMLYAVGAGDQVIAVDDFSNFPPETADKRTGISGYEPNVEAILALGPDLVITEGSNTDLLDALSRAGVTTWVGAAATTLDDVYAQILEIGEATGHADEAAAVVEGMRSDVAALMGRIDALADQDEPLSFYHELDPTYYSVTSDTFIGTVYDMLGLRNIADLAEGESYGYPQLSAEFIVDKDPDIIFLACTVYCGDTPETVAARPGWDILTAVAEGNVIPLDDDTASRWGPRIVDHMDTVVTAVEAVITERAG